MFLKGADLSAIWRAQVNMYNYHSQLTATHPFSSVWWGWPIIYKPMGYVRDFFAYDMKISITAFGNPAIWWFSIISMVYTLVRFIQRRDLNGLFILVGVMAMYVPYLFIGRIMYIYHFYYALPIFMLSICYMFNDLIRLKAIKNPKYIYLMFGYMAIIVILFVLYYPVLSGIVIENSYVDEFLIWFKNRWWM
jgi:dolichyl-phosphate-mannose--protein O-mannosyl transferase